MPPPILDTPNEVTLRNKLVLTALATCALAGIIVAAYFLLKFSSPPTIPTAQESSLEELRTQEQKIADIIKTGDIAQCEKIKDTVLNGTDYYPVCRNNILINQANASSDVSKCDAVDPSFSPPTLCKQNIIQQSIARGSPVTFCDGLDASLAQYCRNVYWTRTAIQKGDGSLCKNLTDTNDATHCRDSEAIEALVFKTKDVACTTFSLAYQKGCAEFKQLQAKVPKGVQVDCSVVGSRAFSDLCDERVYMDNI